MESKHTFESVCDSGFGSGKNCSYTPTLPSVSQGGTEGPFQELIQELKLEIQGLTKMVKSLHLEMQMLKEVKQCQPNCQCSLRPSIVPPIDHGIPKVVPSNTQRPSSPGTQMKGFPNIQPPSRPGIQATTTCTYAVSDSHTVMSHPTQKAEIFGKKLVFPKFENFVSFNQYVLSLNSHVDALLGMGHTDKKVSEELYQFLAQSQHSAQFLHQIKGRGRGTKLDCSTILSALQGSEMGNALNSPEERFKKLRKVKRESLGSFLIRCEQYSQDVPFFANNPDVQCWQIKMQFLKGARIPQSMHDSLLPYANLSEFLLACKRLLQEVPMGRGPEKTSFPQHFIKGNRTRLVSCSNFRKSSPVPDPLCSNSRYHGHYDDDQTPSKFPSLMSLGPVMASA